MSALKRPKKRFNLLLLEEGEYYFEDYACFYLIEEKRKLKGRLKICSHSVLFVSDDSRYPIVKYPFKHTRNVGQPPPFLPSLQSAVAAGRTALLQNPQTERQQIQTEKEMKQIYFVFQCPQIVEMKDGNEDKPYNIKKVGDKPHIFELVYVTVQQLAPRVQELAAIFSDRAALSSFISRREHSVSFDVTWLEDPLKEHSIFEAVGNRVTPLVHNPGRIMLTNFRIYFQPFNNVSTHPVKKYKLNQISRVVCRRHLLKNCGIEIYFCCGGEKTRSVFFAVEDELQRDALYSRLIDQPDTKLNLQTNDATNMTLKWQNGSVSNFDYLMYLNSMADRTFNDLTQYPVFPWVIQDYTSDTLDLDNPATFRDLSKPIGALNPSRLQYLQDRLADLPSDQPKFLYGTHYSTPAYVLYYLVRQAPAYMLRLQNGRFDAPDRLFDDIADTWSSVLNNPADLKELIPEFYDVSNGGEFLMNSVGIDLGVKQSGRKVHHVLLPPWALDARDFVRKCRDALESPCVSQRLHHWIDLIFGYKQRGEQALAADNLFYHLTYEGAVDIDKITDPLEREAIEQQIREFGQTPKQLFTTPHPQRIAKKTDAQQVSPSSTRSTSPISSLITTAAPIFSSPSPFSRAPSQPLQLEGTVTLGEEAENESEPELHSLDALLASSSQKDGSATVYTNTTTFATDPEDYYVKSVPSSQTSSSQRSPREKISSPRGFELTTSSGRDDEPESFVGTFRTTRGMSENGSKEVLSPTKSGGGDEGGEEDGGETLPWGHFAGLGQKFAQRIHKDRISSVVVGSDNTSLYTASHDSTVKIYSLSAKRQLRSVNDMGSLKLSSLVLSSDEKLLIGGSWDDSIYFYSISNGRVVDSICAHDDAVSSLALQGDTLLSASWDATIKVWKMGAQGPNKTPLLELSEHEAAVKCLALDSTGTFAVSGCADGTVILWDLRLRHSVQEFSAHSDEITCLSFCGDARRIVSCSSDGSIRIFESGGGEVTSIETSAPVLSMATNGETLLAGDERGSLCVWDLSTGDEVSKLRGPSGGISALTVTNNGRSVVTGSMDGDITLWTR